MNPNIMNFIAAEADFDEARAVIFGAPFDGTTSFRPGTRFGPGAIRAESDGIETYSPYQNKDLEDIAVFDSGDLLLPFGNTEAVLEEICARTAEILETGKMPVMLGGEHLVTLGAVRAMVQKYPELHIIHFDAHTDLRDDYLGERLSHATVIRRCHDLLGDGRIHQFGIRSGERAEWDFAFAHTDFHPFNVKDVLDVVLALGSVAYASDLGGIQRTVQLWLNGEMTDATLTVNEGSYTLRYPDKDGTEHEMGGGGIAIEDDGTERPLTEEELFEQLNEPEVEEREDGTVTVYYLDQKLDVTDKFDEDGVCYVQLEGGEKTIYMTIKRGNGYATSTTKYILPSEFNN